MQRRFHPGPDNAGDSFFVFATFRSKFSGVNAARGRIDSAGRKLRAEFVGGLCHAMNRTDRPEPSDQDEEVGRNSSSK